MKREGLIKKRNKNGNKKKKRYERQQELSFSVVSTAHLKESGGGAHGLAVSGDNADALLVI